jgi:hypothetical protein
MSWLDLSNVSNIFRQSYVNGFLDVSRTFIARGDASLNSNLFVAGKTTLHGDASLNGNLKVGQSIYENGNSLITKYATLASPTFTGTVSGISKSMVQLGNVDNTSDANKPISTATQTALDLKAPLASPALTGTPTAPTPSTGTNSTQLATTAFVRSEISNLIGSAPTALDTLQELAAAINSDASFASTVSSQIGLKAPTANPSFTGIVSIPTANISQNVIVTGDVSSNRLFVTTDLNAKTIYEDGASLSTKYASLVSPVFTGTIAGITKDMVGLSNVDNTSDINKPISSATQTSLNLKAPLASPTFTGTVGGITKDMVGLSNVDNTSDINKPISSATQTSLNLKAPLASPTFTGTATIPTASVTQKLSVVGDASFGGKMNVQGDVSMNGNLIVNGNILPAVGGVYNLGSPSQPFNSLYINTNTLYFSAGGNATAAISYNTTTGGLDVSSGNALSSSVLSYDGKVPIGKLTANAALDVSGNVIVTGDVSLNSRLNLGNNAILGGKLTVLGDVSLNSNVNVGGSLTAITQSTGDNSTKVATTEFVKNQAYATLASPSLTGTPLAPTATTGTNTQQLATTAFVRSEISNLIGSAPAALDTLQELATAINGDAAFASTVTTQIGLKAPINNPTFTGTVGGITKAMVGLGNVDNTSDANKPASSATQAALDLKAPLASPVFTGTVSGISKAMVGLSLVDNTADASKPVSTAQQTAIDVKANIASPTFTGTVGGISKAMVGLGNVENTSDANKPISSATQTALDLKAQLASPTFTGVVSGISKAMVGLSLVDNTPDTSKPVSTAQQAALDLKANIFSPAFTGTVTGITKDMVGLSNADNTSDANKPISSATQTALNLKSTIASPTFTGTVTMPTTNVSQKLAVTGDASFNSKVDIASDLTVTGNLIATYPANSVPTTALSGKVTNTQLTNSSVTIGSTLVALGATTATLSGLTLASTTILTGDASMNSRIYVGQDASFGGKVFVASDVSINGNLTANYPASSIPPSAIIGGVSTGLFANDISANSRLFLQGDASFGGKLFVNGDVSLNGNLRANYPASSIPPSAIIGGVSTGLFTNDISANARLFLQGDASFGSNVFVSSDLSLNGNAFFGKDLTINGNLTVNQYQTKQTITTLNYQLQVAEDLSVNGRIFTTGDVSMNGKVFVAGDLSVNGMLRATYPESSIPPSAIIGGVSTGLFSNDISANSRLFLQGDASFGGKVFVANDLSVNGILTANYLSSSIPQNAIIGGVGYRNEFVLTPHNISDVVYDSEGFEFTKPTSSTNDIINYNSTDLSLNGNLVLNGTGPSIFNTDVSLNVRLYVGQDASFGGKVFITSDVSINGNLRANYPASSIPPSAIIGGVSTGLFTNDISANARLFLQGDASFGGKLFVNGDVSLNGNVNINGSMTTVTQTAADNSTKVATTEFVKNQAYATLASPSLTGTPLAPTATTGTNTQQLATTAFVRSEISNLIGSAPAALDTLQELATAINSDAAFASTVATQIGLKAPINNPTFTGTVQGVSKAMVGLGNVDNTSDVNKPVSTAQQAAIDAKANIASPTFTGTVGGITKAMVGLSLVDNTADASKPVSTAQQTAIDVKANIASPTFTGTVGGISKAMVGLGNADNTSDANKPISSATQTALDLKATLASPTFTGVVSGITKAMVGLSLVDNTPDASKPVSTAQQAALDLKANIASPTFTGTVGGISKAMVGLGNVENTNDANKPVSSATQAALDLKATLASPTFTGVVSGITKSMVGLSLIDNTADASKPVSTAQQAAIDAKANIASPTFTGTVGGITKAMVGLGNVENTSDANKPISSATQTALDLKSTIASPTFTGTPLAPTATTGTNTQQLATTAFVRSEISNLIGSAPAALDTLQELAAAINGDAAFASTVTTQIGLRAPISNPTFTGTATIPTANVSQYLVVSGDASLNGKVTVSSDLSVNGNLRANYPASSVPTSALSGTVSNTQLTNSAISIAGTSTALGGSISAATIAGAIPYATITNDQLVKNSVTIGSTNIALGTTSSVISGLTLASTTILTGDASMNARLFVGQDASFGGKVFVASDVSINGNLRANYPESSIPPSAIIGGVSTGLFTNDISANSRLFLQGDASFGGKLFVNGDVSLNGNVNVVTQTTTDNSTKVATTAFVKSLAYAPLASPELTGTPLAPTPTTGTNTTQIATTAFVRSEITNLIGSAPAALDTLQELAAAINGDAAFASTVTTQIGLKAPLASPAFTGTATMPNATISQKLVVTGDASFNGLLVVGSDLSVNGMLRANYPAASIPTAALSGTVSNTQLANNSVSIAGSTVALGGSITAATIASALPAGAIANSQLTNNSISIAGTSTALGDSITAASIASALPTGAIANSQLTNKSITIAGVSTDLGGSITAGTIAGAIPAGTITNTQLTNNSISIAGTSTVLGGSITAASIASALPAGAIANSQLANKSITIAGVSTDLGGSITAASIAGAIPAGTITNSQLANNGVTIGSTVVALGSTTSTLSGLTLASTTTMTGDASMNARMFVGQDASFGGKVFVASDVSINGNLRANYPASSIPPSAIIGGVSTGLFTNDISANARLFLQGDASFGGKVFVSSDLSLNGNVFFGKDLTINGNLTVNQYQTKQTITTLNYQLQVAEDLSVNGRVFTTGDVSMNGNVFVAGDLSVNGLLRATYPESSIPPSAIIGGVSTGLFTNDISANSRLFLQGDASLNGKVFIAGDLSLNGNIVGYTKASTPSVTLDSWLLTNLVGAPPAVVFGTPTATSTYIYIPWTYPSQQNIGALQTYVPAISSLTITYDISNGSSVQANILSGNTSANCIASSSAILANPNVLNNSSTPITGVILAKSGSGPLGATGFKTITFPSEAGTRNAYLFTDSNIAALTNSSIVYLHVYYSNYKTSVNDTSANTTGFAAAGTPSAPRNLSVSSTSSSQIVIAYYDPSFGDQTNQTTSTSVTAYQVTYTDISNVIRYYGISNLTVGPNAATGGVPTTNTPSIPASTPINSASTTLTSYIYPDSSYSIFVQAKNTGNTSFGPSGSIIYASTSNVSPTYTDITGISAASRTTTTCSRVRDNQSTNIITDNTAWNFTFNAPIHETANRGNLAAAGTIATVSANVSGAKTVSGPVVNYTGFPISTPISVTANSLVMASSVLDSYTANSGSDGFYLYTSNTLTLQSAIFTASSEQYTVSISRTGPTSMGPKTSTFYYDTAPSAPTIGSFALNRLNTVSGTTYKQVSGINVVYGSPTLDVSAGTIANVGQYFYNSSGILRYTASTGVSSVTTNNNDNNLTYMTTATSGNALVANIAFSRPALTTTLSNSYAKSIALTGNVVNISGTGASTTRSSSIAAIVDQPSITLVYSTLPSSINSINNATASYGYRIYSGKTSSSTTYIPSSPIYYTGSSTYSSLGYNHSWDITSSSNTGSIDATDELQIGNGNFQTYANGYTSAYLDYTSYYFGASTNTANYSGVSQTGYRYATFAWKLTGVTGSGFNRIIFSLAGNTSSTIGANSVTTSSGNKIQLFYRVENPNLPTPSDTTNLSTYWIDGNYTPSTVVGANYFTTSQTGLDVASGTTNTQFKVLLPYTINTSTVSVQPIIYCRIGLPMQDAYQFQYITAQMAFA